MAHTIPAAIRVPTLAVLRAQLLALELMYDAERRCENARRILDLIHAKRDEIAVAQLRVDRVDLDLLREVAA